MDRNKIKLNNVKSQREVNQDLYEKLSLSSSSRPLPYNNILKVVNENEQFNKERQESTKYRLVSTINGLFTNVLFNTTETNSWSTLNTPLFRDRSYPPNAVSINEAEDFTFAESIEEHLIERGGWFGYESPKRNEYYNREFTYMEPSKLKFDLVVKEGDENWGVTMTYPATRLDNELTQDGLDIISMKLVRVGGKDMTALAVPYRHNLSLGDNVKITNTDVDGTYQVQRVGLDNGDFKENYFVIDVPIENVVLNNSKFKKLYYNQECEYYFRVYKRLNNEVGEEISDKDFDKYPIAFSKNVYGDNVIQLATKKDVDLTGLVDNLGRPVSEIYLTTIKHNNKGFTNIKSGLLLNDIDGLGATKAIPDIRRIHNGVDTPFTTNTPLNDSVLIKDDEFIGDLVEYNKSLLTETVLARVNHRFNTTNRESNGITQAVSQTTTPGVETTNECVDIRAQYVPSTEKGKFIGSVCYETQDDTEKTEWFLLNDTFYSLYKGGGSNTSCSGGDNEKVGTLVDSFQFNGNTIYPGNGEEFRIYSNNHIVNGTSYTVYLVWEYMNGRNIGIINVYLICNSTAVQEEVPSDGEIIETETGLGVRQEGYMYQPFNRIKLRSFSEYIEYGDENTYGIPEYAEKLDDGRYIWRDMMDIGINDSTDYPFLNGTHYLHQDFTISLRRQDPFGEIGLQYKNFPSDISGIKLSNNKKINRSGDVC